MQKCGTTSMASYLRAHPGVSGLAGMPGNDTFSKESHFFGGILGASTTTSSCLYRSFFPTFLTRWVQALCRGWRIHREQQLQFHRLSCQAASCVAAAAEMHDAVTP